MEPIKKKRGRPKKLITLEGGVRGALPSGGGVVANEFIKKIESDTPQNTPVELPKMGDIKIDLPKYLIVPKSRNKGGYKWRLASPTAHNRNISQRLGQKSIEIIRKNIENPSLETIENSDTPLIKDFSPQDRKKIYEYFKEIKTHEGATVEPSPVIPRGIYKAPVAPVKKSRGRPRINPPKIKSGLPRGRPKKKIISPDNIIMDIKEKKPRGRPRKVKDVEGAGVWDSVSKAVGKAGKAVNSVVATTKDVAHKLVYGTNELPPKARATLDKYGDATVTSGTIMRIPLGTALMTALNVGSMGKVDKEIKNADYDKLYHLRVDWNTSMGEVTTEKNEVINIAAKTAIPPKTEFMQIPQIPQGITLRELIEATARNMGGKFLTYSSKDNNCQDFVMGMLNGNNMNTQATQAFAKQDVKPLFTDSFRKLANTVTDIGAKAAIITQGGGLESDSYVVQSILFDTDLWSVKKSMNWLKENKYKHDKVDLTAHKLRFRQHDPRELSMFPIVKTKDLGDGIELVIYYKHEKKMSGKGIDMYSDSDSEEEERKPKRRVKVVEHHHHYHHYGMPEQPHSREPIGMGFDEPPSRVPRIPPTLDETQGMGIMDSAKKALGSKQGQQLQKQALKAVTKEIEKKIGGSLPHRVKGSEEAKAYMAELRTRRQSKN